MKVVIQHPVTRHFLNSRRWWKSNIEDAHVFDSAFEAFLFGSKNIVPPYNVVLRFKDPQYDSTVLTSEHLDIAEFRMARHEHARWMAAMKKQCQEMIRSSKLLIGETRAVIASSKKVIAGSKKSIAAGRRRAK